MRFPKLSFGWIGVILVVAAALRFYGLGSTSLNNDELSAITRAHHDSFSTMIEKGVLIDYHPAGVEAFLYYWIKVFGDDPWIVRIPFVMLSLLSIYLIYRSGKKFHTATAGLLAASVFAVMELPLLYTTLARMYSPGIFFSVCAMYFAGSLLLSARTLNTFSRRDQLGFVLSVMFGVHTHYFVPVYLAGLTISVFIMLPGMLRGRFLLLAFTGPLSFIPELRIFMEQMKTGDLGGWLAPPGKDFLLQFIYALIDHSPMLLVLCILTFLPVLFLRPVPMPLRRWGWSGVFAFFFSFALAYAYSVWRHPALQPSTLLFSLPGLLLAIFSLVPESFFFGRRQDVLMATWLIGGAASTVLVNNYYESRPYGVFKEVAEDLARWHVRYRMPAVVNVINPEYLNYYFRRMTDSPSEVRYEAISARELALLREQVDTTQTDHFAYAWTNCLHPYQIRSIISSRYPRLLEARHYFNAESFLYARGNVEESNFAGWWEDFSSITPDYGRQDDTAAVSPPAIIHFTPEREFSAGLDTVLEMSSVGLTVYYGSVWFRSVDTTGNASLDMKVEQEGATLFYDHVRLNDYNLHPGRWQRVFLALPLSDVQGKVRLQLYIWNSGKSTFDVDNLEANVAVEMDPYERK